MAEDVAGGGLDLENRGRLLPSMEVDTHLNMEAGGDDQPLFAGVTKVNRPDVPV
jgi:hypothetical protein